MKVCYLFITIVLTLTLFTACNQATESKESGDQPQREKMQTVKKQIEITYVDVYLDQGLFYGGNPDTGLVVLPFQSEGIVYLPVNVFAEKMNDRKTEWDSEKKELTIGKANNASDGGDYRVPDVFPTQINVSFGGISLFMKDEEVPLDESEQLLVYESTVYANAELLCEIFDRKIERCDGPVETLSGTLQYRYINISDDLSRPVNIASSYIESDVYKLLHP